VPGHPPLLSGLSAAEQQELLASAQPRLLPARGVLGEQGATAELLALVQVGHLKLSRINEAGAETLVRFVGPGDCYGAIVLRPDSRYPVSATAVQPSRVLVWPRRFVMAFAERVPRLRTNLFDEVTRRMSAMLEAAQELATERTAQRVARALLRVAEHGGVPEEGGIRIVHPLTRQEVADLTGTTLFTVSRLMSRWETDGLLRSGRGAVTILDPEGLELAGAAERE
jgi:CRP-like cAMP-binding protein